LCERAEDVVTCGRRYCHRGGWQSWKQGQNASKLKFLDENLDFSIVQHTEVAPLIPLIHHYKRKVSANARNFLSLTDGDITIVEGENDGSKGKTLVKYNFRRYGTGPFLRVSPPRPLKTLFKINRCIMIGRPCQRRKK
jgi:hypothetical protein